MILYHYKASPFAEKIRLTLGYTGLDWQSMTVPSYPPRPLLEAMLPGYRKIPVAQIGGDIFCDSAVISEEIAEACGKPELVKHNLSRDDLSFLQNVELDVFLSTFAAISFPRALLAVIKTNGLLKMLAFINDRQKMAKNAIVSAPDAKEAKAIVNVFLASSQQRLTQNFFGGDAPNALDFAIYNPVWSMMNLLGRRLDKTHPTLFAWYERMAAFGHGECHVVTKEDCWQAATQEPRALPPTEEHEKLGKIVTIAPTDYAQDETSGMLVCATKTRLVLETESEQFGRLHFHFPRTGFRLL